MKNWNYRVSETNDFIEIRRGHSLGCNHRPIFFLRADLNYDESDMQKAVDIYDFAVAHELVDTRDVVQATMDRVYDRKSKWFRKAMADKKPFIRRLIIKESAA